MKFSRNRFTLDQALSYVGLSWATDEPFISYDPDVVPQYYIRRNSVHDGTLLFSIQLMWEALKPLITRTSYYKPDGAPENPSKLKYVVGQIKRISVYGNVDLPCGNYPGERELVIIPVRVV